MINPYLMQFRCIGATKLKNNWKTGEKQWKTCDNEILTWDLRSATQITPGWPSPFWRVREGVCVLEIWWGKTGEKLGKTCDKQILTSNLESATQITLGIVLQVLGTRWERCALLCVTLTEWACKQVRPLVKNHEKHLYPGENDPLIPYMAVINPYLMQFRLHWSNKVEKQVKNRWKTDDKQILTWYLESVTQITIGMILLFIESKGGNVYIGGTMRWNAWKNKMYM